MRIAIISDTHDYIPHIDTVLDYCVDNNIDRIIHCGDICKVDTLDYFVSRWHKPFDFCFGNGDLMRADMQECAQYFEHVSCHGEVLSLTLETSPQVGEKKELKILGTHYPQKAIELDHSRDADYIFYGHTHKPWIEEGRNAIIANPGALTGMVYETSFAILDCDTQKLELVPLVKLTIVE